jgi:hypothetical protein
MGKETRNLGASAGTPLHTRETLFIVGTLGALNAEVQLPADGCGTVSLDIRSVFVGTIEVQGSVDGTNWVLIPLRPFNSPKLVRAITAVGLWTGDCSQYLKVRALMTAWTSGAATTVLAADTSIFTYAQVTTDVQTITAAAGVIATLTIAAPGLGLRHYLTYVRIAKFAAAALVAAAAPVLVTTTNIPGTLVFTMPADAQLQGTTFVYQEDFAFPVATVAQNTATVITGPVTTNVIWRITAGYFVAP